MLKKVELIKKKDFQEEKDSLKKKTLLKEKMVRTKVRNLQREMLLQKKEGMIIIKVGKKKNVLKNEKIVKSLRINCFEAYYYENY